MIVALEVFGKAAVGRLRERAARDGQLVVLHLVADLRVAAPCFGFRAVRRRESGILLVLELVGFKIDGVRGIRRMVVRVDDVFEVALGSLFCAVRGVGVRRAFHEADAVRVLHEFDAVGFVALRRSGEGRRVDFELRPVEVRRLRSSRKAQQRVRGVEGAALQGELDGFKVLDVAGLGVGLDVQGVARSVRLIAAMDCARDRDCANTRTVAEVDGVARRRTRAVREAAVDVARYRAARNGDGARCRASRRRAVGDVAAVDVSCDGAALNLDLVLRRASRRACRAQGCVVETAVDCTGIECGGVFRSAARFCAHFSTVGVESVRARVEDEAILFGVARGLGVAVGIQLGVRDESAARDKRRTAARQGQLVVLHLVADARASAPCVRGRAACISRRVVLEAIASEVDVLGRRAVAVGHDVGFVVRRMDAAARSCRAVVRKVDVVRRMAHERQDRVTRGACIEAVEVVDVEFLPVEVRRATVQGQEGVACLDVAARRLEVDRVKIGNVARRDGVVDVERVVRGDRFAAAVNRADRRA